MKNVLRITFVLIAAIAALDSCKQPVSTPVTLTPAVEFYDGGGTSHLSGESIGLSVHNDSGGDSSIQVGAADQANANGGNAGPTYYTTDGSTPTTASSKTGFGGYLDLLILAQQITGKSTPPLPITVKLNFVSIGGTATAGAVGTVSNPFTITIALWN